MANASTQLLQFPDEHSRHDSQRRFPGSQPVPGPDGSSHYGHTPQSSVSSQRSEPISPGSYGGSSSRSPVPQYAHDRVQQHPYHGQTLSRDRDEAIYEQRRGAQPYAPYPHSYSTHTGGLGPPPPPSGPDTILPPPPDPFLAAPPPFRHGSYAPHAYAQHPQLPPVWDGGRGRYDSAINVYDPAMAQYGQQWAYGGTHGSNSMARKRRGNLPKEATKILKEWFGKHQESPYPTEDEKQELCRITNLQISQVCQSSSPRCSFRS